MRQIKYISPTSLHLWERDREQFYIDRLCPTKGVREEQSPAASVGSAFDAFVKSALHHHIYGDSDPQFDLQTLFETQVDNPALRDFAWKAGQHCFDRYRFCGAYDELLQELLSSTKAPKFEFTLMGEVEGIPLAGKPDIYYYKNAHVLYDWKVMGFCSKYAQSPRKLYKTCRDTWSEFKPTRGGGEPKPHKKYEEVDYKGHRIGSHWMEETDSKWADQLCIYGWLCGVPVETDDFVVGIDQLCCKPNPDAPVEYDPVKFTNPPLIRVAQHRCRISVAFQSGLIERLRSMWSLIESGHIFDSLSREESDQKIEVLDMTAKCGPDANEELWMECGKKEFWG